jgi:hypothetical protein
MVKIIAACDVSFTRILIVCDQHLIKTCQVGGVSFKAKYSKSLPDRSLIFDLFS